MEGRPAAVATVAVDDAARGVSSRKRPLWACTSRDQHAAERLIKKMAWARRAARGQQALSCRTAVSRSGPKVSSPRPGACLLELISRRGATETPVLVAVSHVKAQAWVCGFITRLLVLWLTLASNTNCALRVRRPFSGCSNRVASLLQPWPAARYKGCKHVCCCGRPGLTSYCCLYLFNVIYRLPRRRRAGRLVIFTWVNEQTCCGQQGGHILSLLWTAETKWTHLVSALIKTFSLSSCVS